MSAKPQQQTNEWCRISQLQTWISTIKLVEKYETANWFLRQGDEEVNKRIKQKLSIVFIVTFQILICDELLFLLSFFF